MTPRSKRATPWLGPAGKNAFDFPMAYCWRAYYQETFYGEHLPYLEPEQKPPQDIEVRYIHHNVNDTRRVFAKLNAVDRVVKYLLNKELEEQKQPRSQKKIVLSME